MTLIRIAVLGLAVLLLVSWTVAQAGDEAPAGETTKTEKLAEASAKLAERAHHLADVRWRNGMGTPLEVSDALLRMQDSQVREVLALKDYRLSLARLERAAGRPVPLISRHFDEFSFDALIPEDRKP